MLFSPEAHEAIVEEPWDPARARDTIAAIAADAEAAFDDGWPVHALDREGEVTRSRFATIYLGGAGVVDGLRRLSERGYAELGRDYLPYLEGLLEGPADFPDYDPDRSLWMGETGIRLVLQRLAPSEPNLARLGELIAANAQDMRCELMWGSPGTILAGRELGLDVTPSVEWLQARRDPDGLWTQDLYGRVRRFLGPAHGFAGCVLALGDPGRVSETLRGFAVVEDGLANWPAVDDLALDGAPDGQIRVQWCHGAPGIVATLGSLLDEDLALGGGELTWRAGPLVKGANLCHGTGGNGYAFLALFERTGDELWLDRARAFAMHSIVQVEAARAESRPRPLHALDGRSGHGSLPRGLHRRRRHVAASVDRPFGRWNTSGVARYAVAALLLVLAVSFPVSSAAGRSSATPSIVYASFKLPVYRKGERPIIWTAAANGSHARELTYGDEPALSPDGHWIAFVRAGHVDRISSTGGPVRTLWAVSNGVYYIAPAWSPNSSAIAIGTRVMSHAQLAIIDVATGARTVVASGTHEGPNAYDFSPDGSGLAYAWDSPTRPGVFVYDRASGHTTRVAAVNSPGVAWGPHWIAYAEPMTAKSDGAIWLVHDNGSERHRLTWQRGDWEITPGWWSEDGSRLVAFDPPRHNGRILIVELPSGHIVDLTGWVGDLFPQAVNSDASTILTIRGCGEIPTLFGELETISVSGDRWHLLARGPCSASWNR